VESAGPPKANLDLIEDQQNAVAFAQLRKPCQETRRRHHVAAIAHHALNDDARDLLGGGHRSQQILEIIEHLLADIARKRRPVRIGVGQVYLPGARCRRRVEQ
jgi:hypothetical protein